MLRKKMSESTQWITGWSLLLARPGKEWQGSLGRRNPKAMLCEALTLSAGGSFIHKDLVLYLATSGCLF